MPTISARQDVIERLTAVFRASGYDGASLSQLSAASGLGKSSLYHHFPDGKADMARAVLANAGGWVEGHVIAALTGPGTPHARLTEAFKQASVFYNGGKTACLLELFAVGEAAGLFGDTVRDNLLGLTDILAQVAQEAGVPADTAAARAEEAMLLMHGALVYSRGIGDTGPFQRTLATLPDRLLGLPPFA